MSKVHKKKENKKIWIFVGIFAIILVVVGSIFFLIKFSLPWSSDGISINLAEKEEIEFKVVEEGHKLSVDFIGDNFVNLIIQSETIVVTLNVGEIKKFDLDGDLVYDIKIKLESIVDGKANIIIIEIDKIICVSDLNCTEWSSCSGKIKTRICNDINNCNDVEFFNEEESCEENSLNENTSGDSSSVSDSGSSTGDINSVSSFSSSGSSSSSGSPPSPTSSVTEECTPNLNVCQNQECGTVMNGTCGFVNCGECVELNYEEVLMGVDFDIWQESEFRTLMTIEHIDLSDKANQLIEIYVDSDDYVIDLCFREGYVDKNEREWEGGRGTCLKRENPIIASTILEPGPYSIIYYAWPNEDNIPLPFTIRRAVSFLDTSGYVYSEDDKTVIVDYSGIRENLNDLVKDPQEFFLDVNLAYDEFADFVGHDSDVLIDGHLTIEFREISGAAGWAGNPIIIHPNYIGYEEHPGWAVLHELGHDLTNGEALNAMYASGCSCELWASFLAFYSYDSGLFSIDYSNYDRAYFDGKVADYNNKKEQALIDGYGDVYIGLLLQLKDEYGWEMFEIFFEKYIDKPLDDSSEEDIYEKRRAYFVKSLAESAMEITGNQEDYNSVVDLWVEWEFIDSAIQVSPYQNIFCRLFNIFC